MGGGVMGFLFCLFFLFFSFSPPSLSLAEFFHSPTWGQGILWEGKRMDGWVGGVYGICFPLSLLGVVISHNTKGTLT